MAKRPILEWIILAFLAYGIVAALPSMMSGPQAGPSAPIVYFGFGLIGWVVSILLVAAIWVQSSKRVVLAWTQVAIVALGYVYALSIYEPLGTDELSSRQEYTGIVVFFVVVLALHSLIPIYYMRAVNRSP